MSKGVMRHHPLRVILRVRLKCFYRLFAWIVFEKHLKNVHFHGFLNGFVAGVYIQFGINIF